MKVLVFGSSGYIGSHLVNTLRARGHEVIAESSRHSGSAIDSRQGCLRVDYQFPRGIEVVYYLSQSPFYRDLPAQFEHVAAVNCFTPCRLARLASNAGVGKFIYTSTGSVYEPAFVPLDENSRLSCSSLYVLSKISAEIALLQSSGETQMCCPRLFGVYGPGQSGKMVSNLIQRLLNKDKVFLEHDPFTGRHSGIRMSMTFVEDAVAGLISLAMLNKMPPLVNLAGKDAPSIRDLVMALSERMGVVPSFDCIDRDIPGYFVGDSSLLRRSVCVEDTPLFNGLESCLAHHPVTG